MKKYLSLFVVLSFLVLPAFSQADEEKKNEESLTTLEEVVVTATRSAKSIEEVFADVDVVTRKDIEASSASNVDDILRKLAGVDVRRPADMIITSPQRVSIRGVGGKRILMMVDGVPINSPMTGFVQLNQIPLSSIERVEVVKGGFSSLYGSNAMGGVINIITDKKKADGIEVKPMAKYGSYEFKEMGANLRGREGKLSYFLDANHRAIDNGYRRDKQVQYSLDMSGKIVKTLEDVSDHSEYKDKRVFAKLDYELSKKIGLTFSGHFAETDSEMGYTTAMNIVPARKQDTENKYYFFNLNGHTRIQDWLDLDMRVYSNYNKSYMVKQIGIGTKSVMGGKKMPIYDYGKCDHWGRDTGIQLKTSFGLGDYNHMIIGVDSRFISGEWENTREDGTIINSPMDKSINSQAVYIQNETDLFSTIILTLGARYDIDSESENSFSPKIGLLYRFSDRVSFRGSAGRSFRAPNLGELYAPTWLMGPYWFSSNPDLKPEIIWSYDLGTRIKLTDKITFNLTGFYSKADDLITTESDGYELHYKNADEVDTDGFEAGLEGNILPWLNIYANYTYTHSVDKEFGRLEDRPLHQANAGIRTDHRLGSAVRLIAALDARYNGAMDHTYTDMMTKKDVYCEIDDFTVLDLKLRTEIFDRLGISAAITNITDEDYEIHGENLGPERCYWVGVDYRF